MNNRQFASKFKKFNGQLQLVDQNISMPLKDMGKEAYQDAKVKEEPVGVRALFLDSERWIFRKITMPKLINQ